MEVFLKILLFVMMFVLFSCSEATKSNRSVNNTEVGGGDEGEPEVTITPGGMSNASLNSLSAPNGRLIMDFFVDHAVGNTSDIDLVELEVNKGTQEEGVFDFIGFERSLTGSGMDGDIYTIYEVAILDGVTVSSESLGDYEEVPAGMSYLSVDIATACVDGNLSADYTPFSLGGIPPENPLILGGEPSKGGSYRVTGVCDETVNGLLATPETVDCTLYHRDDTDFKYMAFIAPSDTPDGCDFFIHRDHALVNPLAMSNLEDAGLATEMTPELNTLPVISRLREYQ